MEYRSKASFLGLPLLHVATGTLTNGEYRRGVATAWIAVGDIAFGVIFSFGAIAVGGISFGGVALGLLPIGGATIGWFAIGGLGIGILSVAGAAIAWHGAVGGLAIAHHYAVGGLAIAPNVLTPPPSQFPMFAIPHSPFSVWDALFLVVLLAVLVVVTHKVQALRNHPAQPGPRG